MDVLIVNIPPHNPAGAVQCCSSPIHSCEAEPNETNVNNDNNNMTIPTEME